MPIESRNLFDSLNVRRADPDTSRESEEANAEGGRSKQCEDFLKLLREAGAEGLTDYECHVALGLEAGHTPRLNDLRRAGLAVPTARRKVPDGKARPQRVWVAKEFEGEAEDDDGN